MQNSVNVSSKSLGFGITVGFSLAVSVIYFQVIFMRDHFTSVVLVPYISVIVISAVLAAYLMRKFAPRPSYAGIFWRTLISLVATLFAVLAAGQLFSLATAITAVNDGFRLSQALSNFFVGGLFTSWIFVSIAWPVLLIMLGLAVFSSCIWHRGARSGI